jgi:hypothetical protein
MTPHAFSLRRSRHLLLIMSLAALTVPGVAFAQDATTNPGTVEPAKPAGTDEQIDFAAGRIDYDSNADIVTAADNVVLNRDGYSLRADTVIWNRKTGEVTANGNIKSIGPEGDVAYGDSIKLTDTLKSAPMVPLNSNMPHTPLAKSKMQRDAQKTQAGRSRPPRYDMIRSRNVYIIPVRALRYSACHSFRFLDYHIRQKERQAAVFLFPISDIHAPMARSWRSLIIGGWQITVTLPQA